MLTPTALITLVSHECGRRQQDNKPFWRKWCSSNSDKIWLTTPHRLYMCELSNLYFYKNVMNECHSCHMSHFSSEHPEFKSSPRGNFYRVF
jgi:nitrate/TMAO reductase-like tetraheme cytochrome c subunit